MSEKRKPKMPTRVILVRHLNTEALEMGKLVKQDDRYKTMLQLFENRRLSNEQIQNVQKLGAGIMHAYGFLPRDAEISIVPGQEEKGKQIGKALVDKYGMPDRWEVTPYRRTQQTSELLREGITDSKPLAVLPRVVVNKGVYEKSIGDADIYPTSKAYLTAHPKELVKYLKDPETYRYPHGESLPDFKKRIKRNVASLRWLRKYEGKTTVVVAHSFVIEKHSSLMLCKTFHHEDIGVGSVTVFEAEPKRFLRPRKYRLVNQLGEKLV